MDPNYELVYTKGGRLSLRKIRGQLKRLVRKTKREIKPKIREIKRTKGKQLLNTLRLGGEQMLQTLLANPPKNGKELISALLPQGKNLGKELLTVAFDDRPKPLPRDSTTTEVYESLTEDPEPNDFVEEMAMADANEDTPVISTEEDIVEGDMPVEPVPERDDLATLLAARRASMGYDDADDDDMNYGFGYKRKKKTSTPEMKARMAYVRSFIGKKR